MSKSRNESQISELIIHCAATTNGRWFTASDIDQWHKMRRFKRDPGLIGDQQPALTELKHIGYHFVIGIKGGIESGRNLNETGAHAVGHNGISIGTCLIGMDKFTDAQWEKLKENVLSMKSQYPGLKVIGHREINHHKVCPGFDVQAWLKDDLKTPLQHRLDAPS